MSGTAQTPTGTGGAGGSGAGGGLYMRRGSVSLLTSTISGNKVYGGGGGAGQLVRSSHGGSPPSLNGNGGAAQGAGLFVGTGALRVRRTTVSGNMASGGTGVGIGVPGFGQGAGLFVGSGNIALARSRIEMIPVYP